MKKPDIPANEAERLSTLRSYEVLDTPEEPELDEIARRAAESCGTPIALVSLVDRDRQWFKAHFGLEARETPRDLAFCAHAIHGDQLFIVDDSLRDPRFADNPLVTGEPNVRFYAGVPLSAPNGLKIGTLCVIDHKARSLSAEQLEALKGLSQQVMAHLEQKKERARAPGQLQGITAEIEALKRSSRLSLYHKAAVAFSVTLTIFAWQISQRATDARNQQKFDREADQAVDLIVERMKEYEGALWSGAAAVASSGGRLSEEFWKTYTAQLQIERRVPGVNGIGFIYALKNRAELDGYLVRKRRERPGYGIHPQHPETEFWPITYIEPREGNAQAIGLDIAFERNRFDAVRMARDTGASRITAPIVLVQDSDKTPGFLFFAPVYRSNGIPGSIEARRREIIGVVYAPFIMKRLMLGTLEKQRRLVNVRLSDEGIPLFDELQPSAPDHDPDPAFRKSREISLYGRSWRFEVHSALSFRRALGSAQPLIVLLAGILLDSLLFTLFLLLSRSNRRAIELAERTRQAFAGSSQALAKSNSQLIEEIAQREQISARLALAVRAGGVGVWDYDPRKEALFWDHQMYSLYGVARNDFRASYEDWRRRVHPEDLARTEEGIRLALRGEREFNTQFRILRPDGSERTVRAMASVERDGHGNPLRMIGTNRDITEQKETELALEKASAAKSDFLSMMSHEIRTPLNGIIGMSSLLQESALAPQPREYVDTIARSGRQLLALIDDILDFSKIEAGRLELEELEFGLPEAIEEQLRPFRILARRKGVELEARLSAPGCRVRGDAARLGQLLSNLLSNAVKFTHRGKISVEMSARDRGHRLEVRLEVRDTGIGIPAQAQPRIFQAFSQSNPSTSREYGGTGLGLSIARRLAELMGGSISFESREGEGSCFRAELSFPKAAPAPRPEPGESLPERLSGRVLVAEDNPTNQLVIMRLLEAIGCRHHVVGNGHELLAALRESAFDLILMDCRMPGLDGYECSRKIRASAGLPREIPIVALTANAADDEEARVLAAGMNAYLPKPVEKQALAATLARFLRPEIRGEAWIERATHQRYEQLNRPGQPDLLLALIESFLESSPPRLRKLLDSLLSGDAETSSATAHALKSSAYALGAMKLGDLLAVAETAEADQAERQRLATELEAAFAASGRELRRIHDLRRAGAAR